MKNYLTGVWRLRYFWLSLVHIDLRSRYRGSWIGMGWSLLHPLAMTAVLFTVFTLIYPMEDKAGFALYLLVGLTAWIFITTAMNHGCQAFFHNESYIRQHPAPLAIYPLRVVLGAGIHLVLGLLVAIIISWSVHGLSNLAALPALLPALALLFVLGWSLAILMGVVNVLFQDTQLLLEVLLQVLFYLTPIIYPPQLLNLRHLDRVVNLNPLTWFLDLIRQPILDGRLPSPGIYAAATVATLLAAGAASLVLSRIERRMIFYL